MNEKTMKEIEIMVKKLDEERVRCLYILLSGMTNSNSFELKETQTVVINLNEKIVV